MASVLAQKKKSRIKIMSSRNFEKPRAINYEEDLVLDIDFLQCIEEISFIEDIIINATSIAEIGSGYGRTAYGIIMLFPSIKQYYLIDLPPVLQLAKEFLKIVLDDKDYNKLVFIKAETLSQKELEIDLCLNINSFQEMPSNTIQDYLQFIDKSSLFFYTNNTVGKFKPELCEMQFTESTKLALEASLLTQQIDIFCIDELKAARQKFLEAFRPSNQWTCFKHGECSPWPHYYQALYSKSS